MPIFFTISSFKTFGGCRSTQLHKLHFNSNHIWRVWPTEPDQLQKLQADFFHYIQFEKVKPTQLQKLHLISNQTIQIGNTDRYQLQKLHADFFHYIQFQNVQRVSVYPTTETTPKFEWHSPAQADRPIPTTETTCRFVSLYPVSKRSEGAGLPNYTNYT